jgi:type VI secretion system lysozyme-like protein
LGPKDVAPAPLFDRLVDLERRVSREPRPLRMLSRIELLDSVQRELELLLNSRCALTAAEVEAMAPRDRSVIDYGVPDLGWVNPQSSTDRERGARIIAVTIAAFEPRLQDVSVTVDELSPAAHRFTITISGTLVVGPFSEPVAFPLVIATTGRLEDSNER